MGDLPSIFRKMLDGEPISNTDPEFHLALERYAFVRNTIPRLNSCCTDDERRAIFNEVFDQELDPSVIICPPFFTDWGKFIKIGKNTFINGNCTLLDQGGIEIGENVMFGPGVSLITPNHGLDPANRRVTTSKKITIGDNVWIGANSTVLPGVTIGDNSVVAACSVVTKDVPPNTVVMGHPARVYKTL